jgi:hypothetical protein
MEGGASDSVADSLLSYEEMEGGASDSVADSLLSYEEMEGAVATPAAATAPHQCPHQYPEECTANSQWANEMAVLVDMGFDDEERLLPLLQVSRLLEVDKLAPQLS